MSQKVLITRVATVLLMGMALTGCGTMKGWFAGKDAAAKKAQEPAELVKFEPTVKVSKIWSVNLGKGERRIGVRQGPAVANGQHHIAHGVQLFDAKQLAGKVPAHTVQVKDGRGIGASCRPPPGMQALVIGESARAQVQLLDTAGQAMKPTGLAWLDAKYQLAFLVLQDRAAGRQGEHQGGGAQPGEPATA